MASQAPTVREDDAVLVSIGEALVYSLDREAFRLSAQANKSIRIPLRFFSQAEALIVGAAASRKFPSDEAGPRHLGIETWATVTAGFRVPCRF